MLGDPYQGIEGMMCLGADWGISLERMISVLCITLSLVLQVEKKGAGEQRSCCPSSQAKWRGSKSTSEVCGGALPGDPVVGNLPAATRNMSSILQAEEQLSLCSTTTEACTLKPGLHNKRSHHTKKPTHN